MKIIRFSLIDKVEYQWYCPFQDEFDNDINTKNRYWNCVQILQV